MKLYSENKNYKLYQGNMLDMLDVINKESIDAVLTDPPYELNFMGKGWDNSGIAFQPDTWQKCYEVLKPGGYLLAFGGSRTFHRIACAIEDAGFEIRDTIMWLYGSGFPKSMDISKQIDKRPNKTFEAKIKFGELIKEYRNKNNLTQRKLGELIGVSRELINLYEIKGNYQQQIPIKEQWKKIKEILNISNDMDYIYEEAEREVIGTKKGVGCFNNDKHYTVGGTKANDYDITIPTTDLAKQWQGWGTALKPSFEPIIVARKPFKGSLVDNVIEYGVGGINIDECRVDYCNNEPDKRLGFRKPTENGSIYSQTEKKYKAGSMNDSYKLGRFPANTILTYDETDFEEVCEGFPDTKSGIAVRHNSGGNTFGGNNKKPPMEDLGYNDSGSASRYFYCAKASKKDRDEGLDEFEEKKTGELQGGRKEGSAGSIMLNADGTTRVNPYAGTGTPKKNTHPTVKPTDLMQYLVRLVTPNGGTILDPFNGSGSTGKAVMYENKERNKNYKYIGIELTEEYLPIAKARIEYVCKDNNSIESLKENTEEVIEGQTNIFDFIGE